MKYFDYAFHPECFLVGNFKNVFSVDLRTPKSSLLLSSELHSEDLTFNKISGVRRLNGHFNQFALVDEERFYIYDIR